MAAIRILSRKLLLSQTRCDCTTPQFKYALYSRFLSYVSKEYVQDSDPAPVFFNAEVQSLLKSLTRVNLEKVFKKRKLGDKTPPLPTYKFMSEDQLEEARNEALRHADEMLQMPPVLQVRQPINNIICVEPALKGLDTSKFVFTDITFGVRNSERVIVVREADGTLREADWQLKDRMNQIYFPIAGKQLTIPKMFEEDQLKKLLGEGKYEFILDKACLQFEPNDSEYQRVTSVTYQHINDNNGFEALRSTRHFGPLSFFLAWFKIMDNLLLELIETSHIEEACTLVNLYGKIHNVAFVANTKNLGLIEEYVSEHSNKKGPLELALQAYKDIQKQRQEFEEGIKRAHGF